MSITQDRFSPGTQLVSTHPAVARYENNPQNSYMKAIEELPEWVLQDLMERGSEEIQGFFILPQSFRGQFPNLAIEIAAIGLFAERMVSPWWDGRRHGPNASSWSIFPGELKASIDFILEERRIDRTP